jgi:hypothetical protein
MIVEEVFDKQYKPPSQRRPNGHLKAGATKKGNKKRGLRGSVVSLLDDDEALDEEDDEDVWVLYGGRPPALTSHVSPYGWCESNTTTVNPGQVRWPP